MTSEILRVSMMLLLTIGFFVGLMVLLKYLKKVGPGISSTIEILGGASVSHKAKVVMIKSQNKKILLGVTDSHVSKLHVFDETDNDDDFKVTLNQINKENVC